MRRRGGVLVRRLLLVVLLVGGLVVVPTPSHAGTHTVVADGAYVGGIGSWSCTGTASPFGAVPRVPLTTTISCSLNGFAAPTVTAVGPTSTTGLAGIPVPFSDPATVCWEVTTRWENPVLIDFSSGCNAITIQIDNR